MTCIPTSSPPPIRRSRSTRGCRRRGSNGSGPTRGRPTSSSPTDTITGTAATSPAHSARECGATGATVITNARGEGLKRSKTFFGLTLETQRDVMLFLVEEHLSRTILEKIAQVGEFDEKPGTGIAFQVDVEDAVGVAQQVASLTDVVEENI